MEISYFEEYYAWADIRIIESLNKISDEALITKIINPDGRSIRDMVEHIAGSYEMIFNNPTSQEEFKGLFDKIKQYSWVELIEYWKKWLNRYVKAIKTDSFPMPSSSSAEIPSKNEYIFSYSDHSTYHRGQLAFLINLTGNKAINTDYYSFLLEKHKQKSS